MTNSLKRPFILSGATTILKHNWAMRKRPTIKMYMGTLDGNSIGFLVQKTAPILTRKPARGVIWNGYMHKLPILDISSRFLGCFITVCSNSFLGEFCYDPFWLKIVVLQAKSNAQRRRRTQMVLKCATHGGGGRERGGRALSRPTKKRGSGVGCWKYSENKQTYTLFTYTQHVYYPTTLLDWSAGWTHGLCKCCLLAHVNTACLHEMY